MWERADFSVRKVIRNRESMKWQRLLFQKESIVPNVDTPTVIPLTHSRQNRLELQEQTHELTGLGGGSVGNTQGSEFDPRHSWTNPWHDDACLWFQCWEAETGGHGACRPVSLASHQASQPVKWPWLQTPSLEQTGGWLTLLCYPHEPHTRRLIFALYSIIMRSHFDS